jgi:ribonuclease P protein component
VETLKTGSQFERVRRVGRTWAVGPILLNAAQNNEGATRCGFITGKKVGKAVERNRARRLIKEAVRARLPQLKPGWDLVWIARASIAEADFAQVSAAVDEALTRGKLYAPVDSETASPTSRIMESEIRDQKSEISEDKEGIAFRNPKSKVQSPK